MVNHSMRLRAGTFKLQLGLDTIWPHAGTYEKFQHLALLLPVQAVLKR